MGRIFLLNIDLVLRNLQNFDIFLVIRLLVSFVLVCINYRNHKFLISNNFFRKLCVLRCSEIMRRLRQIIVDLLLKNYR
jgi:hypothetical protein